MFLHSLGETVLLRCTTPWVHPVGTPEEGGGDLGSCLVGGTALVPCSCAGWDGFACCGEERRAHRSTKQDQAPLLTDVALCCLVLGVRPGLCGSTVVLRSDSRFDVPVSWIVTGLGGGSVF